MAGVEIITAQKQNLLMSLMIGIAHWFFCWFS